MTIRRFIKGRSGCFQDSFLFIWLLFDFNFLIYWLLFCFVGNFSSFWNRFLIDLLLIRLRWVPMFFTVLFSFLSLTGLFGMSSLMTVMAFTSRAITFWRSYFIFWLGFNFQCFWVIWPMIATAAASCTTSLLIPASFMSGPWTMTSTSWPGSGPGPGLRSWSSWVLFLISFIESGPRSWTWSVFFYITSAVVMLLTLVRVSIWCLDVNWCLYKALLVVWLLWPSLKLIWEVTRWKTLKKKFY